jgi:hypothetical protein
VLRHQLIVLRRRLHGRVRLTNHDRWFFIQLYRWFPSILQVLTIIRPETLVRWHRAGFRCYWRRKSRPLGGRPQIDTELRGLIRRMSMENAAGILSARLHRRHRLSCFVDAPPVQPFKQRRQLRRRQTHHPVFNVPQDMTKPRSLQRPALAAQAHRNFVPASGGGLIWIKHLQSADAGRRAAACNIAGREVSFGSNSEVAAIANHVCSTPNNRHLRLERTLPFRANMRHSGPLGYLRNSDKCLRLLSSSHGPARKRRSPSCRD